VPARGDEGPAGVALEDGDLRMPLLLARAQIGVDLQHPEARGEGLVLLGREVLISEEDHSVGEPRPVDLRERRVLERVAQVDARDLCAEGPRGGMDSDVAIRHGRLPNAPEPGHRARV
jgi:hypothetical protein